MQLVLSAVKQETTKPLPSAGKLVTNAKHRKHWRFYRGARASGEAAREMGRRRE